MLAVAVLPLMLLPSIHLEPGINQSSTAHTRRMYDNAVTRRSTGIDLNIYMGRTVLYAFGIVIYIHGIGEDTGSVATRRADFTERTVHALALDGVCVLPAADSVSI